LASLNITFDLIQSKALALKEGTVMIYQIVGRPTHDVGGRNDIDDPLAAHIFSTSCVMKRQAVFSRGRAAEMGDERGSHNLAHFPLVNKDGNGNWRPLMGKSQIKGSQFGP